MDDSTNSFLETKKARLAVVFLMIAVVTVLHYSTMGSHVGYHTLYREFYFIPIILMSFWYGLKKGLYTAVFVIFLYLPHIFMTWTAQPGVNLGNLLQIIVFILVAVATGHLSDREKERHRSIIEAQKLATLGRATLAMTSELQVVLKSLRTLESSSLPLADRSLNETMRGAIEKISILNEILSKFRPGQEDRQKDFVEIGGAIERACEKVGKLAKARGITVKTQVDANFGMLRINREDLIWILEELIKNAIEHSENGTTVTIRANRFEDRHEIAVTDQGRGITPENLSKIFVPFYTTKENGTGLGLSVCRKMMRDNEGDVLVESKPGEGSTFTLVFPQAIT
ncbi:MAG: HAMP domain-containing sensor histidine kinase [Syntrophales bacterium]|nr:HAMP domain-containing sensor histidine kinase [Syntrophales bacterium]